MTSLTLPRPSNAIDELSLAVDRARRYAEAAHATSTLRSYKAVWRAFSAFCRRRSLVALPALPQTVVLYVSGLAESAKLATVRRHVAGIAHYHREHGFETSTKHDVVRRVLAGVARTNGSAQTKKAAIDVDTMRALLLEIPKTLKGKRDRALVLLGWGAALRRSEIAALDVDDVRFAKEGIVLTIRRSKTDQNGVGHELAVPRLPNRSLCPVLALREWIDAGGITSGPLFVSFGLDRKPTSRRIQGQDVANLVKALAGRARLEGDYSAHSLRAGFCTGASQAHVSLERIATVTRHRSLTVLAGYVRRANLFEDPVLVSIVAPKAQKGSVA